MTNWSYASGDETPFACPACATLGGSSTLRAAEHAAVCMGCGRKYPVLGGVPCFVPEPERVRFGWLRDLREYELFTQTRQREIEDERARPGLLQLTRERLSVLVQAMSRERALVRQLLEPLLHGLDAEASRLVPGGAGPAREVNVLEMFETVFRDWAWGEAESERALSLVERLARVACGGLGGNLSVDLGKLAVLGAGACRLAADVQRVLQPQATYALDNNPLPLLVAARVLGGSQLEAYEYPTGPRDLASTAVLQRLRCSTPRPEGLQLVLADALAPPFVAGSLDSVLTPWFIDVVAADLPVTVATIARLLRPGGLWLNQGPLRFSGAASRRYSIEEVRELVAAGGFEITAELTEDVPYFDSPHSGARRLETVYGFAARKVATVPAPVTVSDAVPWANDVTLPIPLVPELRELQERLMFSAGALSLIDGERSIVDLAEVLGAELGVGPERLVEPLRGLLVTLLVAG